MKKYERQNLRRRFGCDPKAYANLLALQQNKCALCGDQATRYHKLLPDGKIALPCFGQLVCRHCKHVIDAYRRNPGKVRNLFAQQEQELATEPAYVTQLYAKRG